MNKQPFYHRAVILFTATRPISQEEFALLLIHKLKDRDIMTGTILCEALENDAGDPQDLV